MATKIIMPKLSDTMTEGQLGVWRKSVGEQIERGDILAEVETDKATMDLEAFTDGILLEQRVKAGELVPVGTVIGLIGTESEATTPPPAEAVQTAPLKAASPAITTTAASSSAAPHAQSVVRGVQAAPIVRRRAAELGIDLTGVPGSGPGGRIMLEDLQRLSPAAAVATTAAPLTPAELQPLSRMRSAIARTTSSSWQNIPHYYLTRDVEMDSAEQVILGLQAQGASVTLNGLIMTAAAAALHRFPALNSGYSSEGIIRYEHVNLAFAVALAEGLQTPVIRDAETMKVSELTAAAAALAAKARQGTLTPDDISGGSFTVSNLGMYGVDALASIIMPGQAAILALGTVADRSVVHDRQLAVARVMTATLSSDHRIIDGATAAGFLNEVKRLLEHPAELSP